MNAVWVTGAGGLIGSAIVAAAPKLSAITPGTGDAPLRVVALTRQHLDLLDPRAVRDAFRRDQPAAVIHCAALSRSPDCAANPALARAVNVAATALLAELSSAIPFLFFSSDLVFDGRLGNYDEESVPNPLSVYGATKLEAEQIVLRNPGHTVVRTSLNGGRSPTGDRGFNEQLVNSWRLGRPAALFVDEFRSPIAALATASAVWGLLQRRTPGLCHLAGAERLSRFEIGRLLAARWPSLNPVVQPVPLKDYRGEPRAPDTTLDCTRAARILGTPLPRFSEWLQKQPPGTF